MIFGGIPNQTKARQSLIAYYFTIMYIGAWQEYNLSRQSKYGADVRNRSVQINESSLENLLRNTLDPISLKKALDAIHPFINNNGQTTRNVVLFDRTQSASIKSNNSNQRKAKFLKLPRLLKPSSSNTSSSLPSRTNLNDDYSNRTDNSIASEPIPGINLLQTRKLKTLRKRDRFNSLNKTTTTLLPKIAMPSTIRYNNSSPRGRVTRPLKPLHTNSHTSALPSESSLDLVKARQALYSSKGIDKENNSTNSSLIPSLQHTHLSSATPTSGVSTAAPTSPGTSPHSTGTHPDLTIPNSPVIRDMDLDEQKLAVISKYFSISFPSSSSSPVPRLTKSNTTPSRIGQNSNSTDHVYTIGTGLPEAMTDELYPNEDDENEAEEYGANSQSVDSTSASKLIPLDHTSHITYDLNLSYEETPAHAATANIGGALTGLYTHTYTHTSEQQQHLTGGSDLTGTLPVTGSGYPPGGDNLLQWSLGLDCP